MNTSKQKIILFFLIFIFSHSNLVLGQQKESSFRKNLLYDELEESLTKIQEMTLIIQDLKVENETIQDILKKVRSDNRRLEQDMADLLAETSKPESKRAMNLRLSKVREPYEEEIEILNNIIASYKMDFQEKEDEIAELLHMNRKLKRQVLFPEEEKRIFEQRMDQLTLEYNNLKEDYEEKIQDFKNTVDYEVNKVRDPLKANIEVLKEQIKTDKQEHHVQQKKSEKNIERLNEKIESYKAQIQRHEKAKTRQDLLVKQLNDKIEVYKNQRQDSDLLIEEQNDLIDQLRGQHKSLQKDLSILRRENELLEGKNKKLIKNQTKTKSQGKQAVRAKQQSNNNGAYINLLKEEIENALDLLSY